MNNFPYMNRVPYNEQVEILKTRLINMTIRFVIHEEDIVDFREEFIQLKQILSQYKDEVLVESSFKVLGDIIMETHTFFEDDEHSTPLLKISLIETDRVYQIEVSYGKKVFSVEIKRY